MPGIATNLLTQRLRHLERAGVVERGTLPPPADAAVYQLTPLGEELEPVVRAMSRWGAHFVTREPRKDESISPNAYMLALRMTFRPGEAGGVVRTFEVRLGKRVFSVHIEQAKCTTWEGVPDCADISIATDVRTFSSLLWQRLNTHRALASRNVVIDGDPADLELFVRVFAHRRAANTERP